MISFRKWNRLNVANAFCMSNDSADQMILHINLLQISNHSVYPFAPNIKPPSILNHSKYQTVLYVKPLQMSNHSVYPFAPIVKPPGILNHSKFQTSETIRSLFPMSFLLIFSSLHTNTFSLFGKMYPLLKIWSPMHIFT